MTPSFVESKEGVIYYILNCSAPEKTSLSRLQIPPRIWRSLLFDLPYHNAQSDGNEHIGQGVAHEDIYPHQQTIYHEAH